MLFAWQDRTSQAFTELLAPFGILIGVFFLLAIGLVVARKWFQGSQESDISTNEMLAEFRELEEQGELSPEEYKKIREVLAAKLRAELQRPNAPLDSREPGKPRKSSDHLPFPPPGTSNE